LKQDSEPCTCDRVATGRNWLCPAGRLVLPQGQRWPFEDFDLLGGGLSGANPEVHRPSPAPRRCEVLRLDPNLLVTGRCDKSFAPCFHRVRRPESSCGRAITAPTPAPATQGGGDCAEVDAGRAARELATIAIPTGHSHGVASRTTSATSVSSACRNRRTRADYMVAGTEGVQRHSLNGRGDALLL
jgi:hypothetical protein